jgi:hypothetical protein
MKCKFCKQEITDTDWFAPDEDENRFVVCNNCYNNADTEYVDRPMCSVCRGDIDDLFYTIHGEEICPECFESLIVIEETEEEGSPPDEFTIKEAEHYPNQLGLGTLDGQQ